MIKPTVGRIVWFYPKLHNPGDPPLAAIITCVWSDTCVNLAIFTRNGNLYVDPPTSVLLIQDDAPVPESLYCTWTPCQIGAAKTEQAIFGPGHEEWLDTLRLAFSNKDVASMIGKLRAANVPWFRIIMTLVACAIDIASGNWPAVLLALAGLLIPQAQTEKLDTLI